MMTPDHPPVRPPLADSPEYQACQRLIRLKTRKTQLNETLREIERQLRALEPIVMGFLGENGYQMLKLDGFTISQVREPWVYPLDGVSRASVCEALKLSGLGRYVTEGYSTKALTAYVRELEEHHNLIAGSNPETLRDLLPGPLSHVIEVKPGFRLQVLDKRNQKGPYETQEEGDRDEND